MKKSFELGDNVELLSSSYEDGGHFSGDCGTVIDSHTDKLGQDIRVEWNNGAETCWIAAEDFS